MRILREQVGFLRRRRIKFLIAVTTNRPSGTRRIGQAEDELERLLLREFGEPRRRQRDE